MELFVKIVNGWKPLSIFAKGFILDVRLGSECVTESYYLYSCKRPRSSHPDEFLIKGVLKICSKFTGEHPYRSAKLQSNFIEITFQHGCSPVNLMHIFRTPYPKNTCGWLLLSLLYRLYQTRLWSTLSVVLGRHTFQLSKVHTKVSNQTFSTTL